MQRARSSSNIFGVVMCSASITLPIVMIVSHAPAFPAKHVVIAAVIAGVPLTGLLTLTLSGILRDSTMRGSDSNTYTAEHFLHLKPDSACIYQRTPHKAPQHRTCGLFLPQARRSLSESL